MKKATKARHIIAGACMLAAVSMFGCGHGDADEVDNGRQEKLMKEAQREIAFPSIVNFQEKRNMKAVMEMRDKADLHTYVYVFAQMAGKYVFVGDGRGYPLPYATQYTNPNRVEYSTNGNVALPQADPNGLFMPGSAEATWQLIVDPATGKAEVSYFEERLSVFPFRLPSRLVIQ